MGIDEEFNKIRFANKKKESEEVIDDTPNANQVKLGIGLGLGYLTFFAYIPYIIISSFYVVRTAGQDNILSSVAQMLAGLFCLIFMVKSCKDKIKLNINNFKQKPLEMIKTAIKFACLAYLIAIGLSILDTIVFGESETNANQQSINELYESAPVIAVLFTCVLAPMIEEAIFRYFIFKPIAKRNTILAFVVSAFIFGAIHMSSTIAEFVAYGDKQTLFNDLRSLVVYVGCGCVFCYAYYKSKNILTTILAHMCYNTIATIFTFISFTTIPCKIANTNTTDTSLTFTVETNANYVDSFALIGDGIIVYQLDSNNEEVNVIKNIKADSTGVYTVNNLEVNETYYIRVSYTYSDGYSDELIEESVETYVYTR